jgi:hypothetical protein
LLHLLSCTTGGGGGLEEMSQTSFHVGVRLEKIQVLKDCVKCMAIVLVKVGSLFQPRMTIGATYCVVCAMSKGMYVLMCPLSGC